MDSHMDLNGNVFKTVSTIPQGSRAAIDKQFEKDFSKE